MKRVLALAAVLCVLGASPALGAGRPDPASRAASVGSPVTIKYDITYDFSATAAGIDRIVRDQARLVISRESLGARPAPQGSTPKKSFWKSPWPYVIGACAVITVVLVSRDKHGSAY